MSNSFSPSAMNNGSLSVYCFGLAPICDSVCANLDIASINKLRLTCTHFAQLFYGPAFLKSIQTQEIELSLPGIQSLHELASLPAIADKVVSLTITRILYDDATYQRIIEDSEGRSPGTRRRMTHCTRGLDFRKLWTKEQLLMAKTELAAMQEKKRLQGDDAQYASIQSDLAKLLGCFKALRTLNIGLKIKNGSFLPIGISFVDLGLVPEATKHFRTVTKAVFANGISLEALNVYSNTRGFGVALDSLHESAADLSALSSLKQDAKFSALNTLSLSFSKARPQSTVGFRNFFGIFANLQTLDMVMYEEAPFQWTEWELFRELRGTSVPYFPHLLHCTLTATPAQRDSLPNFVLSCPKMTHLKLISLCLIDGSEWCDVLNALTGDAHARQSLSALSLRHLLQQDTLNVSLEPTWELEARHKPERLEDRIVSIDFQEEDLNRGLKLPSTKRDFPLQAGTNRGIPRTWRQLVEDEVRYYPCCVEKRG